MLVACATSLSLTEAKGYTPEPYQKESKKSAKRLKEGGWQVFGKDKTIDEVLDEHYRTLSESKGRLMPLEGHGVANRVNVAVMKSKTDAARQYASMFETTVEGTTSTQIRNVEGDSTSSTVNLDSHILTNTEQKVKSLVPSAVFYRTLQNGKVEAFTLYLVNKTL